MLTTIPVSAILMVFTYSEQKGVSEMINKELIGKRLSQLRGDKKREEVAFQNQISLSALAMYESGKRIPRDDVKLSLAKYYNKSVESIFFAP